MVRLAAVLFGYDAHKQRLCSMEIFRYRKNAAYFAANAGKMQR